MQIARIKMHMIIGSFADSNINGFINSGRQNKTEIIIRMLAYQVNPAG